MDRDEGNVEVEEMNDFEFEEHLEHIYAQHHGPNQNTHTGDNVMDPGEEGDTHNDSPLIPPPDYIPNLHRNRARQDEPTDLPNMDAHMDTDIPRTDALDNPFIRVVHSNGIHHIAVVRTLIAISWLPD
jgi:hypothetical protein